MKSRISTIFGQLETVAANIMLEQNKISKIETKDFPPGVDLVNNVGWAARFAVVFPNKAAEREFDDLVRELRW